MNEKIKERDTERKILESAEREFLTKGYAGARTTKIAEGAGVTHAMFHYYFRTKEKLFEKIVSDKINLLKQMMSAFVFDGNLSLEDKLRHLINRHLDFIAANPFLPRFMIGGIADDSLQGFSFIGEVKEYLPRICGEIQKEIDKGAEEGKYRKTDAAMLIADIIALNIFSFISSPITDAVLGKRMEDMDRYIRERKEYNYDTIIRKLKP